jgi:hypothetical protein
MRQLDALHSIYTQTALSYLRIKWLSNTYLIRILIFQTPVRMPFKRYLDRYNKPTQPRGVCRSFATQEVLREGLLTPRPTLKFEKHSPLAVRGCLFIIFVNYSQHTDVRVAFSFEDGAEVTVNSGWKESVRNNIRNREGDVSAQSRIITYITGNLLAYADQLVLLGQWSTRNCDDEERKEEKCIQDFGAGSRWKMTTWRIKAVRDGIDLILLGQLVVRMGGML